MVEKQRSSVSRSKNVLSVQGMRGVVAASVVSVGFVMLRSMVAGHLSFLFLCWNLFLAALPLLFSMLAYSNIAAGKGKVRGILWSALWLLFFPNAPYIITDFVHLGSYGDVPMWFDILMIGSFAWSGMMLGFQSLALMQGLIKQRYGDGAGWGFAVGILAVSSYGIYLGRFQRWNSWDLFVQPASLFADILSSIAYPSTIIQGLALTVGMTVFLLIAYYSLVTFRNGAESVPM